MDLYTITKTTNHLDGRSRSYKYAKAYTSLEEAVEACNTLVSELVERIRDRVIVGEGHYYSVLESREAQEAYSIKVVSRENIAESEEYMITKYEL